jgi:hypothetical protein
MLAHCQADARFGMNDPLVLKSPRLGQTAEPRV